MSNTAIREAIEAETLFMSDPNLVTANDQLEKARMDRIAQQRYWEVMLNKKEVETKTAIARRLIENNMPIEQIASITDLPIETVKAIKLHA